MSQLANAGHVGDATTSVAGLMSATHPLPTRTGPDR